MPITLPGALNTRMTQLDRSPWLTGAAKPPDAAPFTGQRVFSNDGSEDDPTLFLHTNNEYYLGYKLGNQILAVKSENGRQSWSSPTVIFHQIFGPPKEPTIVGLSSTLLGLMCVNNSPGLDILQFTFDPNLGSVTQLTAPGFTGQQPNVVKLANSTFFLSYQAVVSGKFEIVGRTASNFGAWGSVFTIPTTSHNQKRNPAAVQASGGELFVFFDAVEQDQGGDRQVSNVYSVVSTNNGQTWAAPVARTARTNPSSQALHPTATQKTAGSVTLAYHDKQPGIVVGTGTGDAGNTYDTDYDASTNKAYFIDTVSGAQVVKVSDFSVKKYDETTSPAVRRTRIVGGKAFNNLIYLIQNPEASPNDFWFEQVNETAASVTQLRVATTTNYPNASATPVALGLKGSTPEIWVLLNNNLTREFWLVTVNVAGASVTVKAKLTEPPNDGQKTTKPQSVDFDFTANRVAITFLEANRNSFVVLYDLGAGGEIKGYAPSNLSFTTKPIPASYIRSPFIPTNLQFTVRLQGTLLFLMPTQASVDTTVKKMVVINTTTNAVVEHGESLIADVPNRKLGRRADGKIIVAKDHDSVANSVVVFDPDTESISNFFDLSSLSANGIRGVVTDSTNKIYIMGTSGSIIIFPEDGSLRFVRYTEGTQSGSTITFGAESNLIVGNKDDFPVIVKNTTGGLSGVWTKEVSANVRDVYFFEQLGDLDLLSLLLGVDFEQSLEQRPSHITLELTEGHRFDTNNLGSIERLRFRQGVDVTMNIGEIISDVPSTVQWFKAMVFQTNNDYEKGKPLNIRVECQDETRLWYEKKIPVTEKYVDQAPLTLVRSLLNTYALFPTADVLAATGSDVNDFNTNARLTVQFVNMTVGDMVHTILTRYGMIGFLNNENKYEIRSFRENPGVDIDLSSVGSLIFVEPDYQETELTNRVTVTGKSDTKLRVFYPEEVLNSVSGTVGWWSKRRDFEVWFSPDQKRKAANIRLKFVKSTTDFVQARFTLFRIRERIVQTFDDHVVVRIDSRSFVPFIIGLLASAAIAAATPVVGANAAVAIILTIIGLLIQVAEFHLDILGQPVEEVEQEILWSDNDNAHQQQVGLVIEEVIDHMLATNVQAAKFIAEWFRMWKQRSRNICRIFMISDLRIKVGDVLKVKHPASNLAMNVLVYRLKRRLRKGAAGGSDGEYFDDIEGYVL